MLCIKRIIATAIRSRNVLLNVLIDVNDMLAFQFLNLVINPTPCWHPAWFFLRTNYGVK